LRLNNLLKEKEQQVIFSFISNYVIWFIISDKYWWLVYY
jgi:hypothetical protein